MTLSINPKLKDGTPGKRRGLLYLGVDGGGTRTTAWLADSRGRVLGRGVAGPSNPVKVGLPAAGRAILAAAKQARAGAVGTKLAAVCVGLAGADRPKISRPLALWLRKNVPAQSHLVTTDAAITLEAALGSLPGIVVIGGTGSIAWGRDPQGRTLRSGGWGSAFDDAGSGYDLGRNAVHAALRAFDGRGPRTRLVKTIPPALKLGRITDIISLDLRPQEIAALTPLVIAAARDGDQVARGLLTRVGYDLAELALALIRRFGRRRGPAIPVVCSGGLFKASRAVRLSFSWYLKHGAPRAQVRLLRREPVEGALALARAAHPASKSPPRGAGAARL